MNSFAERLKCFSCHKDLDLASGAKIMRNEECSHCYASLHSCKMCQFYDQSAYNECREPSADRIVEKDKANFCDYFILSGTDGGNNQSDAEAAANALFKN
tara:strand:- start:503082 stop:503381 length:300 start_codon:yes stop_codon:yes gene_type:complete